MIKHDYYLYDEKQLVQNPKIPLEVMPEASAVFKKMADDMIEIIQSNPKQCVLIIPVGPIGQYPYFVSRVNEENISLKHCWFINMDEYLDESMQYIPMDHPLSFRSFMKKNVYVFCTVQQEKFPNQITLKSAGYLHKSRVVLH